MNRSKRAIWSIDRKVNWRFFLPCCAVAFCLVAAVVTAHHVQASKNADFLLRRSAVLSDEGNISEAARYLQLFVGMNPENDDAQTRLALLLAQVGTPAADFEAQNRLMQALRRHPGRSDLHKSLLDLCLRMGNSRQALREIANLELAADKDPNLWTMIGDAYQANGKNREALHAYEKAIAANPRNLLAFRQELVLLTQGKADKSRLENRLADMLKANADSPAAWLIAHVIRRDNQLPGAKEALEKALELGPNDVEVLLMAAGALVDTNPEKTGDYLARALQINPKDIRILLLYGRWLEARGKTDKALEAYTAGFDLTQGNDPQFAWRIGELLVEKRDFKKLEPCLVTLLSQPAYRPVYLYLRGRVDLLEDKPLTALKALKEALAILESPGRKFQSSVNDHELEYSLQLALASAYSRTDDVAAAIDAARQAHRIFPKESLPMTTLASLLMRSQDFSAAADAWRETLARPPVPPQAYVELARALFFQERNAPATTRNFTSFTQALAEAKRKAPDAPELVLLEADHLIAEGKVDQAITILKAGVQAHPRDLPIALSLCRTFVLAGDFHRAETAIGDTYRTFGSSVPLTVLLARIEWERGNREKSLTTLEAALKQASTPDKGEILVAMAGIAWARGKVDSALEIFRAAAKESDTGKIALVNFLVFRNRLEELQDFVTNNKNRAEDRGVIWRWADSLLAHQRYLEKPSWAKAIIDAHLAVLRHQAPDQWETAEIAGLSAEIAGDAPTAIRAYRNAILQGPAQPLLVERYVRLLIRNNEATDAKEIVTRITRERFATPLDTRLLITSTCSGSGVPAALANAERIAENAKDDLPTPLWLASLFDLAGKTEDAARKYHDLSLAFPTEMLPWLHYARITAQLDRGKRDPLLAEVKERSSVDNIPYLLGHCSLAFGDADGAAREFTIATEQGPLAEFEWRTVLEILRARQA
ncbi:MAG: tetratricopeptide repeat protein [Planctomycetota bacterium]